MHADTDLGFLFDQIARLAAAGAGTAPLNVKKHQQVFTPGLTRVFTESQHRRRVPLLEQRDVLTQGSSELFEIELPQCRSRLEFLRETRSGIAGKIDAQRGNCRWRQRAQAQVHLVRPLLDPAGQKSHLPGGERKRVGKFGEQCRAIGGTAGGRDFVRQGGAFDRGVREIALLGEHVELVQRLPVARRNLTINPVVLEHRLRRATQAAHDDERALIAQRRVAPYMRITACQIRIGHFMPETDDAQP